jgi:hypothetical protein
LKKKKEFQSCHGEELKENKNTNDIANNDYQHIVRKMCNFKALRRIETMGGL